MDNPLLDTTGLPAFSRINPDHVEPALGRVLDENRKNIERLLDREQQFGWRNLVVPMEEMEDRLSRLWSPVSHLNNVMNSKPLRDVYNAGLGKLSEYSTEVGQNQALYHAFEQLNTERAGLNDAQIRVVDNALRDFRLAGVGLEGEQKKHFKSIVQDLAQLQSRFEENVLDASNAWSRHVDDERLLAGLPPHALERARQEADKRGQDDWVFTLDYPAYHAVLTYAENRSLRRDFYEAWVTRASDQGPHDRRFDNSAIMEDILRLRHEAARLLGFANFAENSLVTKMAETPLEVTQFLGDLASRCHVTAQREFGELTEFARERGQPEIQPWDLAFYSEQQRQARFGISDEELRPYFPVRRVLRGMFDVVERLFGISIREIENVESWHSDVSFYEICDDDGEPRGSFYIDLYTRAKKRGGAWMDQCIGRKRLNGNTQRPVAYLVCNFMPPVGDKPALMTHNEVVTLFHEFGHTLHHLLTSVDYPSVAGINGVPWDAVELPSQFMENFVWRPEIIGEISSHYETGEPLPDELFARLRGTQTFQAGMQMCRQLEFALFDFRIHTEYESDKGARIEQLLNQVREQISVVPVAPFNRFAHAFSHVFGGGYAAGYYSYKWAEVLSSDAFSAFEEKGVLDQATGERFLRTILEQGGTRDAMDLFIEFRGRKPSLEPLLRHSGIVS